ncbi:MAG TPA: hypothetical protein VLT86_10010 [Vicinamibacterales bacterium]|nr:hypothetical protein [Vicinamibacterales bacterium]
MSTAIGAWIALVVFWALAIVGWRELGTRRALIFLALWVAGFVGRGYLTSGDLLFTAYEAALDIALVLMIYKRDVTI